MPTRQRANHFRDIAAVHIVRSTGFTILALLLGLSCIDNPSQYPSYYSPLQRDASFEDGSSMEDTSSRDAVAVDQFQTQDATSTGDTGSSRRDAFGVDQFQTNDASGSTDVGTNDANVIIDDASTGADDARVGTDDAGTDDAGVVTDAGADDANVTADASVVLDGNMRMDGSAQSGPPVIIELSANIQTMFPDDQLGIVAVVTDPDGVGDIIGGVLNTTNGVSLGAFVTEALEGTYTLALTWADFQNTGTLYATDNRTQYTLRAVFFDGSGRYAERSLQIELRCDQGGIICDGVCRPDNATERNRCVDLDIHSQQEELSCGDAQLCQHIGCGPDPLCFGDCGTCASDGNRPPQLLFMGLSNQVLTELSPVIVSIVVTDPDGHSDVIGGTLKTASGATYGAFITSPEEASYTATIEWSTLDRINTINTSGQLGTLRSFVARFYDQSGAWFEVPFDLFAKCDNSAHTACNGDCVDLSSDDGNCGSCFKNCAQSFGESGQCIESACQGIIDYSLDIFPVTCSEVCTSEGLHCGIATQWQPAYCSGDPIGCYSYIDGANVYRMAANSCGEQIVEDQYWGMGNVMCQCRETGDVLEVDIAAIQEDGNPLQPTTGTIVSTTGVVTSPVVVDDSKTLYVIQMPVPGPFTGIYVYDSLQNQSINQGDRVQVTGSYQEYYGLSEISVQSSQVLASGVSLPSPVSVLAQEIATGGSRAEEFEGVLVRVDNIAVIEPVVLGLDGQDRGDFRVTGDLIIGRAYDYSYSNPGDSAADGRNAGDGFTSITGILDYSWNEFRLQPRSDADLIRQ